MKKGARVGAGTTWALRFQRLFDARMVARRLFAFDRRTAVVAASLGAAFIIVFGLPLAAALNIWIDEAFTLHTTGTGPAFAWTQAIDFEGQPPLYFVVIAAWRVLDESSVGFARFPSVVFAAAAVAVIVGAAHRLAPRVPPLLVALVTAFNPIFVWAAVEMRVYALVLFVGAVLTWTFFEGFVVERTSRSARIWYIAFAVVGLYTQYYVGFLLVAQAIALLAVRRAAVRPFAVAAAIIAVAFAPFLRTATIQVAASGGFVAHASFAQSVHEIANAVFVFVLPHDFGWSGSVKIAGFASAMVLVAILLVFGRPIFAQQAFRGAIVPWLCALAVFSLIFTVSGVPLNPLRHLVVLAPMSLLAAYLLVYSLARHRTLMAWSACAIFAVFASATFWTQYRPPLAKTGEWQRVATLLSAGDRSTPIAVFPAELALPLGRYLPVATIPIPGPMPFTMDYVAASTLTNEAQVARVLDPVRARSDRMWMVTWGTCKYPQFDPSSYNCRYLEDYLHRRYHLVKTIEFRGALTRLYVPLSHASSDIQARRNAG